MRKDVHSVQEHDHSAFEKPSDTSLLVPKMVDENGDEIVESPTTASKHNAEDSTPPWRLAILTTLPVFMGYSGMIVLQAHIKRRLGIKGANDAAYVFGVGVSFLYLGNLIFRLMHNVLFTCLRPRQRVMVAYSTMAVAHTLLAVMYYVVQSKSVAWVFVSYLLSGVGIGTFESNLISCLTPMGHATKMWAVIGIPVGFNLISIGSFILFAVWPEDFYLQMSVYLFIAAANFAGLLFYIFKVPNIEFEASKDTAKIFIQDLCKVRQWLPKIWKHCLGLCLDMFSVSLFSSIGLYIFNTRPIPLWWNAEAAMPKNAFQAWYFTFSFLGDFISRRVAYYGKPINPLLYLISTAIGAGLILSKVALLAPFGMFMVMFANGSIYAQTTKHVDNVVPKKYNLAALSIWLFLGDVGSFIGAQLVQTLFGAIGDVPHIYQVVDTPVPSPIPNITDAPHKAFMNLLGGDY